MAGRTRAPRKTTQEQLDIVNGQIEKLQVRLDELYNQRNNLEAKQKEEQLMELYNLMSENNLSITEIENLIKNHIQQVSKEQTEEVA